MTNNSFQISRCLQLVKKEIYERRKSFSSIVLVVFAMVLINYSSIIINYQDYSLESINFRTILNYTIVLLMSCTYIFSTSFPLANNQKTTVYLMIPTSRLEKFLSSLCVNLVCVIMVVFCLFLFELFRVGICSIIYSHSEVQFVNLKMLASDINQLPGLGLIFYHIILALVLLNTIMLLGNTIWKKQSYIKSFLLFVFLYVIVMFVCFWGGIFFFPSETAYTNAYTYGRLFAIYLTRFDFPATVLYCWMILNVAYAYIRFRKVQLV